MKKVVKIILSSFVIFLMSFLLSVSTISSINHYRMDYVIKFKVDGDFDYLKLENKDYLLEIKNGYDKFENINVEKLVENNDVKVTKDGNEYTIRTKYSYYETFFISKTKSEGSRVKKFFTDAIKGLTTNNVEYAYEDVFVLDNKIKNENVINTSIGLLGLISYLIVIYFRRKPSSFVYDNENTYFTPFHLSYLKSCFKVFSKTKNITFIAMLFAAMMVCKLIVIPSGFANLGLSFTYLFYALACALYGPISGLIIGFFSDILGFFLFQSSMQVFYFGYTLQSMLAGFVYGIFLYKSKLSFTRVFLARLVINIFLNAFYGSYCFADIMGYDQETMRAYMLVMSLPKNLIYLLPQSILLFAFMKSISRVLYQFNFINKNIYQNMSII